MYNAYFYSIAMCILKTYAHQKINFVRPWKFYSSIRIGTFVVVQKRAVIEDQANVRLVVTKAIIAKDLASRKDFRQKQYLPAYIQVLIFFERKSGKYPETSCLEPIKAQTLIYRMEYWQSFLKE